MKNFNLWNSKKKKINQKNIQKVYFHEREIWWCGLGLNIGFEQDGKGEKFQRPVVVIKKFNQYSFLAIPLTTKNKQGKYYFDVGVIHNKRAIAILSQIKFLDTRRLLKKIGMLEGDIFKALKKRYYSRKS